ncbi:MAG: molecular chaperone DnaJ [archaeon]|jgi:molecular chaperone DnaJ
MPDYYSILGLSKGASSEEVKKAYKKMAKQYHPDISSDKDAEKKFKEVSEAYSVLSDPEKKQNYDNYGDSYKNFQGYNQGFGGGFGSGGIDIDFEDIFNSFGFGGFGDIFGGGGKQKQRADMGSHIKVNTTITFEEAAFGCEKEITYDKIEKCEDCNGTGAEKGREKTCDVCRGTGREVKQQRTPFGIFQSQRTCSKCHGKGSIAEKECSSCRGQGLVSKKHKITVKIPAGIDNGNHLRISRKGHSGKDGEGDLYLIIFVEPHKVFKRDEYDVYAEIPISFTESALGATVEVPTLKGKADLKIPSGTQTGTIFRLKNKGIQNLNSQNYGDEYIKVIVETPKKISKKQRELFEKLEKEEKMSKKRKGFFESVFGKF